MMDRRTPVVQDTWDAGSSTGWTDEKHVLYISSLKLSFVTQLYDGEVVWRHESSYNGNHGNTKVDLQGYWGMVDADGAEYRVSQAEHTGSPPCFWDQEDSKAYYMDDDGSTSEPRQERIRHHARRKNSGGFSASHENGHGRSLSRTELSDQNFLDDETEVNREQGRGCSKKQLKHAADTTSCSVDYSGSSSDFDIGSLNAEPASCKSHGTSRWSI